MLLLQPLRMSFLTIWLSWKQKYSKLNFAAENMGKKGRVTSCGEVKTCYIALRGVIIKENI